MDTAAIIDRAIGERRVVLDEHESLCVLEVAGVPVVRRERLDASSGVAGVALAASRIGFPAVLKGLVPGVAHKTELGLVRTGLADPGAVERAALEMLESCAGTLEAFLVEEHVTSSRELACGLVRDASFGPCVMVGAGGIHAEALGDTAFRLAPVAPGDAIDAISQLACTRVLEARRGLAPASLDAIARVLVALGELGLAHPRIAEIDVNPLLVRPDGTAVAADALVVLAPDVSSGPPFQP